jgi:hypothetical protein
MLFSMNTHTSRIDFVVERLRGAMPKSWAGISAATGIPKDTIRKIAYREVKDPRSSTLDALYDYFESLAQDKARRKDEVARA